MIHFLIISKLTNDATIAIHAIAGCNAACTRREIRGMSQSVAANLAEVKLDAGATQDQSEAGDCQGASAMCGDVWRCVAMCGDVWRCVAKWAKCQNYVRRPTLR
jgi:hypothetical protein